MYMYVYVFFMYVSKTTNYVFVSFGLLIYEEKQTTYFIFANLSSVLKQK